MATSTSHSENFHRKSRIGKKPIITAITFSKLPTQRPEGFDTCWCNAPTAGEGCVGFNKFQIAYFANAIIHLDSMCRHWGTIMSEW